jgi:hypothetical protein
MLLIGAALVCMAFQAPDDFRRERGGENAAAKDALEGKAPPVKLEDTITLWMNLEGDKKPTWETLKGKVVILDFWAHW